METLIRSMGTVRLRVVDVVSWDSQVAKQHGIRSLPSLWLYDGDDLVSDDAREVLEILQGRG